MIINYLTLLIELLCLNNVLVNISISDTLLKVK